MNATFWLFVATLVGLGAIAFFVNTRLKPFAWRVGLALGLVWIGAIVVASAAYRYSLGQGGFKLGVDLVGGTILVYEVDTDRTAASALGTGRPDFDKGKMVEFLKRRIDPNGLLEVAVRPVGDTRFEIILPSGGEHQARIEAKNWQDLLAAVHAKPEWTGKLPKDLHVERGRVAELASLIAANLSQSDWAALEGKLKTKYPKLAEAKEFKYAAIPSGNATALVEALKAPTGATPEELRKFISENYTAVKDEEVRTFLDANYRSARAGGRQNASAEEVQRIKDTIAQQGSLEFRVLANLNMDSEGIQPAEEYIRSASRDPKVQDELNGLAKKGLPPPKPKGPDGKVLPYTWVELSKSYRNEPSTGLSNAGAALSQLGIALAQARDKGETYREIRSHGNDSGVTDGGTSALYYSRKFEKANPTPEERGKQIEYFVLTADPVSDEGRPQPISGDYLTRVDRVDVPRTGVSFSLNNQGANLFAKLTTERKPQDTAPNKKYSNLAIVLDGQIVSAPSLNEPITAGTGQITGNFTNEQILNLINILRSGALPATLKPLPVSESTIGPTLGGDTIFKGAMSIGLAFLAVLAFMLWYYRFAGIVACIALMANLLLTVAFMVLVNAAFTLPGLAGLVLMLGMAVDANVLIYERLREERERGAGIVLALRNGYDRALPTILDTHLTSFFTAIVLYAVGNDQLRGFGISLAAGLVISLYTSLVLTRLMFDLYQWAGKLRDLSMHQLFRKPNFDFMAIRHYWFAATATLTVLGLGLFLARGEKGLNIDFVGGTALAGQLKDARTIGQLRDLLGNQAAQLKVKNVIERDALAGTYEIVYTDANGDEPVPVKLANPPKVAVADDADDAAKERAKAERQAIVAARAGHLPDWSVEQLYLSSEIGQNPSGASRYFTVRSTEKEAGLVQATVYRLLREDGKSLQKSIGLTNIDIKGKTVTLNFDEFASPAYLKGLLNDEFRTFTSEAAPFETQGVGENQEGRYKEIQLDITTGAYDPARDQAKLQAILDRVKTSFASQPQPERLENFDAQLAAETSSRAVYAILASWLAIMLFLWFRFGNWTYGAAVVLCLIHDLCFTLGMIAFSHYLVVAMPGLAYYLGLEDFKIDLPTVAALLTLVGYSVNDTIVVFDRIREVRGKSPILTPQMINDSVNQTLGRTLLASLTVFLVVGVLYLFGGEGVHLFSFVMVVGVIVGTYSSIYIAAPLLLIFGEGVPKHDPRRLPVPVKV